MKNLNYKQAAEFLGISRQTLQRLVADGDIRPAYIRRRVLFPEKLLIEFTEKCARPITARRKSGSIAARDVRRGLPSSHPMANTVRVEPDILEFFKTPEAINEALREVMNERKNAA